MSDLPKFEPLPNVGNVVSNRVTSFNQGYNLYQCINYLQGYVSIVYENMDALLDDWNNFQQVINENIDNIATEETQRVLNQWLSDGTLNELISKNPLWNQKLDRSGGTMTGNIKFSENTKIVGTTPGGNDIDLIHNTNDGASGNYVQFGDPDAKSVINSNQQPVWHNGDDDYLLLTQKQMDDGLAGKVNKAGDTMTGNLDLKSATINGFDLVSIDSNTLRLGNSKRAFQITSRGKPGFYYNNNFNTVLDSNDIVNNLTSSSTTQPLSAAQGKALKDLVGEEFEELWNGSASEWENTISLSKNIFQYKTLIFKVAPQNDNKIYLFSLKIPKNNILTSEDIRGTIFYKNCPGYLNISNYSTTSNLIKLAVQYFEYSKTTSSICTVTKIWGIKR